MLEIFPINKAFYLKNKTKFFGYFKRPVIAFTITTDKVSQEIMHFFTFRFKKVEKPKSFRPHVLCIILLQNVFLLMNIVILFSTIILYYNMDKKYIPF